MRVDVLAAEIGSTTTVLNAFDGLGTEFPRFLGQGQAPTTVEGEGVSAGLRMAADALAKSLGEKEITADETFAASSAAGGLRMTVHGLVYDMTVKAAKEAALGAGANLHLTTAGVLTESDLSAINRIRPNLILLAGGTDYGERETALKNARLLTELNEKPPIIYAGNIQNRDEIRSIFDGAGFPCRVTENVYPKLDDLNVEPTRKVIHAVFEEHITKAPGMKHVRGMVNSSIMPTPGAVMQCARLLYGALGDLIVIDVGGATTDVHSVTAGSDEISSIMTSPEPFAKRTVEGDLGVYINARNLAELAGLPQLEREAGTDSAAALAELKPIPESAEQIALVKALTWFAASTALIRHAGKLRYVYGPSGRQILAKGKDLTKIKLLIGTGGALTRLPGRETVFARLKDINVSNSMLYPRPGAIETAEDRDYIMASLGVMSVKYPEAALKLMLRSLGRERE
ncbi:MAG: glutamate mutase L [Clostridiales bacterium]|jgi:uncharacterized protein (TIGR01319 family)|nr:glutamate mutase L [Clostridiales bacterium]